MMKKVLALAAVACAGSLATAAPSSAAILTFQASDYTGGNHGLWVNDFRPSASRFFSYQDDVFLTVNTATGTGTFSGTAINSLGEIAQIDISLSGWLETTQGSGLVYKKEGGAVYNEATDLNDVDFFSGGSGTITIGTETFNLGADPFRGDTLFQYGDGANAKRADDFGGSAWLNIEGRDRHWDLNFNLAAHVPEPGTWMLMLLGFGAIGASMRSGKRRTRLNVSYS